ASRLGPGSTGARTARNRAPNRSATAATTWASSADPGRRAWSTGTAVARTRGATARTRGARESAPPDTAATASVPAGGKVHRASSPAVAVVLGTDRGRLDPLDPAQRLAHLGQRRQVLRCQPRPAQQLGPPVGLHG